MNMKMNFYYRCICCALFLWSFTGHRASAQANFHLVKDLYPGTADDTYVLVMKEINGFLYFSDLDHGLMKTDGTNGGTITVAKNLDPFWYVDLIKTPSGLYFVAKNWSDGSYDVRKVSDEAGGSVVVSPNFKSISFNTDGSYLTEFDGAVYFFADDGIHGTELWKVDETGTSILKDIGNSNSYYQPHDLEVYNGMLYFVADDGINGSELWKTDGTESGTGIVKNIYIRDYSSDPQQFVVLNNELYFTANNGDNGRELWKTDGTENGTIMVKDIINGVDSGWPTKLTRAGNSIYFEAWDPVNGFALWRSNGTEATTYMVKDINPSTSRNQYSLFNLTAVNDVVYFAGDDGTHGRELWRSDGTEAGTFMLMDLTAGSANESQLERFSSFNGHLFFVSNGQLWKSDGELCNTVQMTFADGVSFMNWLYIISIGDKLYFEARTEDTGGELFYYDYSTGGPKGACAQDIIFADISTKTYGDASFDLSATASSGLPLVFTSSDTNVITINGSTITIVGGGAVTITAKQAGNVNYAPATAQKTITIEKKSQTITFDALPNRIFGEAPFSITATSSSALPVSFSSADNAIASTNGNTITLHGAGEVLITALQTGDNRYLAATPVTQTLSIKLITAVEPISSNKVSVYPNPVADYLTLQGFTSEENVKVQLYRMDGKEVDAQELSGRTDYQLDLNSLTPGIYLVTITSAKGRMSERIIKK
jgi:ELWxxDGT repeat protein